MIRSGQKRMSSDTGKGYASVANSSVTDTKHDKRNLDFPGKILHYFIFYLESYIDIDVV